ncbi:aminopeptidase P family protein [Alteromonas sediminis]|uniref:Aminopeptidase P family protein n=1 Tax=Alteromonas sediminis TaxID=2259342 RepID=A0A3N5Y9L8_9ALTE|nr:Xaa-Pro peptidase family protein [Alteromonas sediminis]RPJ67989.1 aminopeptidase P family protein [Alteromonas sediminis]
MNKRTFLKLSALGMAAASVPTVALSAPVAKKDSKLPAVDMNVSPISVKERLGRIQKAQAVMAEQDISAIVLEPGPAMDYFTGIQWWRSERLVSVVIPRQGDIAIICPFFEESSIRELLVFGDDVRLWQEDENPYQRVKEVLADRGVNSGKLGFESSVRFFVLDGIMSLLPTMSYTSAEPVTLACRMFKSPHEIALMHKASEVTLRAYEYLYSVLEAGMTQADVKSVLVSTQSALGGGGAWGMALFDEASAYPHGTKKSHTLKEGSIILMDCGCNVHGYRSDISRTLVFGEPSKQHRRVWDTVRQGQQIAFEAAQVGTPAGRIDDLVRQFYERSGFGPDYKLPGLSHRTGHGIGMEGHEPINFVRGEKTKLAKGMCLSNEPGIYLPGEFGVRIEDCIYMGERQAHWFTEPPVSIDQPLGKLATLKV